MPVKKKAAASKSVKSLPDRQAGKPSQFDTPVSAKSFSEAEPASTEQKLEPKLDLRNDVKYNEKMSKSKKILLLVLSVLLLLAIGFAVYSYNLYQKSQDQIKSLKANPQEVAKAENKKIIDAVGKLIDLPKNETPTVATVSDAKKLKNQQFFQKAENGDKVLIYSQAKKAILYRESINKIIEVAPINLGQDTSPTGNALPKATPTKAKVTPTPVQSEPTEEPTETP